MCGIVGIVGRDAVNQLLYDALLVLQHRGQDAAGIVTSDGDRLYMRKNNEFCYENSFASCEKSKCWHPTKNGSLKPRNVSRKNNIKAWFTCDNCSHDFDATINHITNGTWCPYCSVPVKKLCNNVNC